MRQFPILCTLVVVGAVHAATPCDFKGLSVGDHATPAEIMKHFGIPKYVENEEQENEANSAKLTQAQKDAAFNKRMERAKKVSMANEAEEHDWEAGPACGYKYCRINYGYVHVGEEPYPIQVGVEVFFDSDHKITSIDVIYDKIQWDEVLALLNTKCGNNWSRQDNQDLTTDYQTKKSELDTVTVLKHRTPGTNPKTGDKCTITAVSRDIIWLHTTPPIYRSVLEIKLVSKNF